MCGNETTAIQLEKKQKRLSNHALKALCFALLILSAYLVQQYTTAFCITHNWRTIILPHCSCAPPHAQHCFLSSCPVLDNAFSLSCSFLLYIIFFISSSYFLAFLFLPRSCFLHVFLLPFLYPFFFPNLHISFR
jgi:hypothetical protein